MNDFFSFRCAVFDCDGVILDSNELKTEAFRFALSGELEDHVEQFINYHREHGGVSRYVKFLYFFKNIKKEKKSDALVKCALKKYAHRVRYELASCLFVPGVIEFIKKLNKRKIPCIVNSGGDQEEIRNVFKQRKIDHLFIKILGSPATKKENLAFLLNLSSIEYPAVFFGDALSDYLAAKEYGLDFTFISGASEWKQGIDFCRKHKLSYIKDFTQCKIV